MKLIQSFFNSLSNIFSALHEVIVLAFRSAMKINTEIIIHAVSTIFPYFGIYTKLTEANKKILHSNDELEEKIQEAQKSLTHTSNNDLTHQIDIKSNTVKFSTARKVWSCSA